MHGGRGVHVHCDVPAGVSGQFLCLSPEAVRIGCMFTLAEAGGHPALYHDF